MIDRPGDPDTESQPTLAEELAAIPYEPLLPVEKRLIAVSLILGVSLLAVLSWASATFFPVGPSGSAPKPETAGSRRAASSPLR
jgi:hypothetical protein